MVIQLLEKFVFLVELEAAVLIVMELITKVEATLTDNFFHMTDGGEICVRLDKKDVRNGEILDAADLTRQMEILTLA